MFFAGINVPLLLLCHTTNERFVSDPKVVERTKREVRLPAAIIAATFIETTAYDAIEIALPGNIRQDEEDGTSPDH